MVGMKKSISFWFLVALGVAGCGGPNISGDWTGKRDIPARPGQSETIVYTLSKVDLHIAAGQFRVTDGGVRFEGDVDSNGDGWILKPKSALGHKQGSAQNIKVTLQSDGKLSYDNPGSPMPIPLVLGRVESDKAARP